MSGPEWNLAEFDRGVVMTQGRRIKRTLAGHLRTRSTPDIVGIRFESRRAVGKECWAVWERADGGFRTVTWIRLRRTLGVSVRLRSS